MDYQKVYDALMLKRIQNPAVKTGPGTVAVHHILPRSMGGNDDKSNLVKLTPKEHFVAHHLLWRIYNNKEMTYAFMFMVRMNSYHKITARIYHQLQLKLGNTISKLFQINPNMGMKNKHHSEETKRKIGMANTNRPSWKKGKHISEETKRKISEANKGRITSVETRLKLSIKNTGKYHTEETKQHLSEVNKGKKLSEDHKKKISESNKGKHHSEEARLKMSKVAKGRHHSEETKQLISMKLRGKNSYLYGKPGTCRNTYWWNNGIKNIRSKECPPGFVPGRIKLLNK